MNTTADFSMHVPSSSFPRVVIVGGGFGGLKLAKTLRNKNFQVVLFDKNNYHTFQPLLYQVATSGLGSDSIASPLRKIFDQQKNFHFRMANVQTIYPDQKKIDTSMGSLYYDYLVIASGSKTNFYGNNSIEENAFCMKQVTEALDLRSKILQNYEKALETNDPLELNSLMDIVIVGGGATGVELAGAIAEMKAHVLPTDYPELDFKDMDVILIESSTYLLNGMQDVSSKKSLQYLEEFGVKVILGKRVQSYDGYKVILDDGTEILSRTLIWSAGVKGATIKGLTEDAVAGERYIVDEYNRIKGYDTIFAIGDVAAMITDRLPKGHPMLAPVAMQQAKLLVSNLEAIKKNKKLKPFVYKNRGVMATIGRNRAVVELPRFKTQGTFAWFIWMFVHLMSLVSFRSRFIVFLSWMWNYFTYDRSTRLIIRPVKDKFSSSKKSN